MNDPVCKEKPSRHDDLDLKQEWHYETIAWHACCTPSAGRTCFYLWMRDIAAFMIRSQKIDVP